MTNRAISWIGMIPFALWLIPLQAKRVSPELFGGPVLQWTTATVNAVLIPLLVLLALKLLATPARKKAGLGLLVSAGLPLVANLTMLGAAGPVMARTQALVIMPPPDEKAGISRVLDRAVTDDEPGNRRIAAGLAYQLWGIKAVWRNGADELVHFSPEPEDEAAWRQTQETDRVISTSWQAIDGQLRQMPWLFAMNLGAFILITGAGLSWHAYRKPRVAPSSATG